MSLTAALTDYFLIIDILTIATIAIVILLTPR